MARVTVEDCIEIVPNRFELVALAAERAKNISAGAPLTVEKDNDKNAVVALREIAGKTVEIERLRESVVSQQQRYASLESEEQLDGPAESEDTESDSVTAELSAMSQEAVEEVTGLSEPKPADVAENEGELSFQDENLDVDD